MSLLGTWASEWKIKFNVEKHEIISLGPANQNRRILYRMARQNTDQERDLQVTAEKSLKL